MITTFIYLFIDLCVLFTYIYRSTKSPIFFINYSSAYCFHCSKTFTKNERRFSFLQKYRSKLWDNHMIIVNETIKFCKECNGNLTKHGIFENSELFVKIYQCCLEPYHQQCKFYINTKWLQTLSRRLRQQEKTINKLKKETENLKKQNNDLRNKWKQYYKSTKYSRANSKIVKLLQEKSDDEEWLNNYYDKEREYSNKIQHQIAKDTHTNCTKNNNKKKKNKNEEQKKSKTISNKYRNCVRYELCSESDCYHYCGLTKSDVIQHAEYCKLPSENIFHIRVRIYQYLSFKLHSLIFGISQSKLKRNLRKNIWIYEKCYAKRFLLNVRNFDNETPYWTRHSVQQHTPDFVYGLRGISRNRNICIYNQDGTYQYIQVPWSDYNISKALKNGHKHRHLVKIHIIATTTGRPVFLFPTYSDGYHSDGKIFSAMFDKHWINQCLKNSVANVENKDLIGELNVQHIINEINHSGDLLIDNNKNDTCPNTECGAKINYQSEFDYIKCSKCSLCYCNNHCLTQHLEIHQLYCKMNQKHDKIRKKLESKKELFCAFMGNSVEKLFECKKLHTLCQPQDHMISDNGYQGYNPMLKRPANPPPKDDRTTRCTVLETTWKRSITATRHSIEQVNCYCKRNKMCNTTINVHDIHRMGAVWNIVAADINYLKIDLMKDDHNSEVLMKKILDLGGVTINPLAAYHPSKATHLVTSKKKNNKKKKRRKSKKNNNKKPTIELTHQSQLINLTDDESAADDDDDESEEDEQDKIWTELHVNIDREYDFRHPRKINHGSCNDNSESSDDSFMDLTSYAEDHSNEHNHNHKDGDKDDDNDEKMTEREKQTNHSGDFCEDDDVDDDSDDDDVDINDNNNKYNEANLQLYQLPDEYGDIFTKKCAGLESIFKYLRNKKDSIFQHVEKYFTWDNVYNEVGKSFSCKSGVRYLKRMRENFSVQQAPRPKFELWVHKWKPNVLYFRNVHAKHVASQEYQVIISLEELNSWIKANKLYEYEKMYTLHGLMEEMKQNVNHCDETAFRQLEYDAKKRYCIDVLKEHFKLGSEDNQNHWYKWLHETHGGTQATTSDGKQIKVSQFISKIHNIKHELLKQRMDKEQKQPNKDLIYNDINVDAMTRKDEVVNFAKLHDFVDEETLKKWKKTKKRKSRNKQNEHWSCKKIKQYLGKKIEERKLSEPYDDINHDIASIISTTKNKQAIKWWCVKSGLLRLYYQKIFLINTTETDFSTEKINERFEKHQDKHFCEYCGSYIKPSEEEEEKKFEGFCGKHCKQYHSGDNTFTSDNPFPSRVITVFDSYEQLSTQFSSRDFVLWPKSTKISNWSNLYNENGTKLKAIDTIWRYFTYDWWQFEIIETFENILNKQFRDQLNSNNNLEVICKIYDPNWISLYSSLYTQEDLPRELRYLYNFAAIHNEKYWYDCNFQLWDTPLSRLQVICSCRSGEQMPTCCSHSSAIIWLLYYSINGDINMEIFKRKDRETRIMNNLADLVAYHNYNLKKQKYKEKNGMDKNKELCICNTNKNEHLIQCKGCLIWYHPSCLNQHWDDINNSDMPRVQDYWHCPYCDHNLVYMAQNSNRWFKP